MAEARPAQDPKTPTRSQALAPSSPGPAAPPTASPRDEPPPPPPAANAPAPAAQADPPARNPWHEVWLRLTLTDKHRKELREKRGLSNELIDSLGFRSSVKSNGPKLRELLDLFDHDTLLELGIATVTKKTREVIISPQLTGWGLAKRGGKGQRDEWGDTSPIIIPYLDPQGQVTFLRPHKGGLSGKSFLKKTGFDAAFRHIQTNAHVYCPLLLAERPEKWQRTCILTEGEFKAAALHQCGLPAIAIPGIQMCRNEPFFAELSELLTRTRVYKVLVVFDNEDKSAKPDPWDRHDTEVWARYTCHRLAEAGLEAHHGALPDEWRENGKADWDGALAMFRRSMRDSRTALAKARSEFEKVVRSATRYYPRDPELWNPSERERIIQSKLQGLTYKPHVLTGGQVEEDDAKTILLCHPDYAGPLEVERLAETLLETRGCYYVPKPCRREDAAYYRNLRKEINAALDKAETLAERGGLAAALKAVNLRLRGEPETITNFTFHHEHRIRTREGEIELLLTFRNKGGVLCETRPAKGTHLNTSVNFRTFCLSVGSYSFMGGDKQLQLLIRDIAMQSSWREVREIERLGHDPASGLWLFGDSAFCDGDTPLFPDQNDVLWHDSVGYRLEPESLKSFAHGAAPTFFRSEAGEPPEDVFRAIDWGQERTELAPLLAEISVLFHQSFGGLEGVLALGSLFTYGFAPETIEKYNQQPGLWIHGRASGGKTTIAGQLMQLWGYPEKYRTTSMAHGTTHVGLDRTLAQYCSIPVHLDEFREDEIDKNKLASIRNAFNRQRKQKGRMDNTNLTRGTDPMTMPIVTGEGSTTDAATRSRFVQISLASSNRLPKNDPAAQSANYNRMLELAPQYHRIGRYLMQHRKTFAALAMAGLQAFCADEKVAQAVPSERSRFTYGCAWAAYNALHELLNAGADHPPTTHGLREFTIKHAATAAFEVAQINFVTKFWTDVVTALERHHTFEKFFRAAYCRISPEDDNRIIEAGPPDEPPLPGSTPCIIVNSRPLHQEYQSDKRTRGENQEIGYQNLSSEIKREPYYCPAPTRGTRSHRFKMDGKRTICWVLRIDMMDEALQELFLPLFEVDEDHQHDLSDD